MGKGPRTLAVFCSKGQDILNALIAQKEAMGWELVSSRKTDTGGWWVRFQTAPEVGDEIRGERVEYSKHGYMVTSFGDGPPSRRRWTVRTGFDHGQLLGIHRTPSEAYCDLIERLFGPGGGLSK